MISDMNKIKAIVYLLIVAVIVTVVQYIIQGHIGFNLRDEGFLWYGSQRVVYGEVPIRDFMAYNPGRYYWTAAVMSMRGDTGIISMRIAAYVFQGIGLFGGLLLLLFNKKRNTILMITGGILLLVWMYPGYKIYDITISIVLLLALAFLADRQTAQRYFIAGICVGLAAVFGQNHGLYGALGSVGLILYLHIYNRSRARDYISSFIPWFMGVIVGFSPVILLCIIAPDFFSALWKGVLMIFQYKSTNLTLPVMWPWRVPFDGGHLYLTAFRFSCGVLFLALLCFGIASVLYVVAALVKKRSAPPAFLGSAFLALLYSHYSFSRADVDHLALGIFPLIVGLISFLMEIENRIKYVAAGLFLVAGLFAALPLHPLWQSFLVKNYIPYKINNDTLCISPETKEDMIILDDLVKTYAKNGRTFIAAPLWPGAYALYNRKSPMWEIYASRLRSDELQKEEIRRIKDDDPAFAIIFDYPLDGKNELRFRNTNYLVDQFIKTNYVRLHHPGASKRNLQVYINKDIVQ